ncbi:MAG: acetylxylan esterase [Prolixibacteraceae bacterium]|jgi:dienelactone hydrolase|nr:acetylxylan esterase [Prolixibacteraceae bacterium]
MKPQKCITILLLLAARCSQGQTPAQVYLKPLGEVLRNVEQTYHVTLKYDKKELEGLEVKYADWKFFSDLGTTLDRILIPLDLQYEKIGEKSYTVTKWDYYIKTFAEGARHLDALIKSYADKESWEKRKAIVKQNILDVQGISGMKKSPLRVISSNFRKHDGYSVENVALEVLPGVYLSGSVYKPLKFKGKIPAMLSPHGHFYGDTDDGNGRYRPDQQYRCATLAKMGAAVFSYSMFAWGESALQFDNKEHYTSIALTMQTWNSIRVLDYLCSLDYVDPERIGVTGASGGGTQTMIITAIDDRIRLSVPTVMLSAHFYGGCACESGLPIHQIKGGPQSNNVEFGAMAAPRPMLVISDGTDWTQNTPKIEFPWLKKIYALYGMEKNVENVHLPTDVHNYGYNKRIAMYDFVARHFALKDKIVKDKTGKFDESGVTIEPAVEMYTFGKEKRLPENAIHGVEALRRVIQDAKK